MFHLLAAGHDPTDHAIPHSLVNSPLLRIPAGDSDTNIPALGIHNGYYEFFITNHLMMSAFAGLCLIIVGIYCSRRISIYDGQGLGRYQTRGRVSQLFETICAFIRDEVAYPNLRGLTDKYIYYIWTVFFFILFANILGIIPFGYMLQMITGDSHFSHWGGSATGNLSLTGVLAVTSLFAIVFIGIRETSLKEFLNHFNPIGWDGGIMMLPIALMLYVLEVLSLLIKCFVLAMRLFGTMMAGHLVLAAFVGLIFAARAAGDGTAFAVSIPVVLVGTALTLLELFVCCLQAFIFTFLTVLFIAAMAVHDHDEHLDDDPNAMDDASQMDPDKIFDPGRISPAVGASHPAGA
ncbi:F0F1 ATP synthase subunit A [Allorhodopirellula solitaria]|uniref:ATP synthase subunit a n=1 Tax=Allorhodopirellula solitaria TaxID=2527987 RepID=A0A5C5X7T6_9BACT|nr:F0F1 ATP synthase subunit A [Allorhodopirellula solitaria]TWT59187.1 ATP synthase subunit a [Allorhodopirellula solitaria]